MCVALAVAQSLGVAYASTSNVSVSGNSLAGGHYSIDLYSDDTLENAITYNGFSNGSVGYTIVHLENQGQFEAKYRVESGSAVLSVPELYLGCNVIPSYGDSEIAVTIRDSGFFDAFKLKVGDRTYVLTGGSGGFSTVIDCPSEGAVVLTGFYSGGDYDEIPNVSMDVVFSLSVSVTGPKAVCADTGCRIDFFEKGEAVTVVDSSDFYVAEPAVIGTHEAYAIVDSDGGSFISNNGRNDVQVALKVADAFCIHVRIDSDNNSGWSVGIAVTIGGTEYVLYPELSGHKGHYDYYIGAEAYGDGYVLGSYGSLSEVEPYGISADNMVNVGASTRGNTSVSLEIIIL